MSLIFGMPRWPWYSLTLISIKCLFAGIFSCFCCRLLPYFNLLTKIFQEHYQSVKRFGSKSGPTYRSKLFTNITLYQQRQNVIRLAIMQGTQKTTYPLFRVRFFIIYFLKTKSSFTVRIMEIILLPFFVHTDGNIYQKIVSHKRSASLNKKNQM